MYQVLKMFQLAQALNLHSSVPAVSLVITGSYHQKLTDMLLKETWNAGSFQCL